MKSERQVSSRYPIPPDLTQGRYIGGFTGGELMLIGTLILFAVLMLSATGSPRALLWGVLPAAIGFLLHRQDNGYGYVAAGRPLWVMLRYLLGDLAGCQRVSLRTLIQGEDAYEEG